VNTKHVSLNSSSTILKTKTGGISDDVNAVSSEPCPQTQKPMPCMRYINPKALVFENSSEQRTWQCVDMGMSTVIQNNCRFSSNERSCLTKCLAKLQQYRATGKTLECLCLSAFVTTTNVVPLEGQSRCKL
jgi:hypothetical protein